MSKAEELQILSVNRGNMETYAGDMQRRIADGEKIPIPELIDFIRFVNNDCKEKRTVRNVKETKGEKPPAPEDVDFF